MANLIVAERAESRGERLRFADCRRDGPATLLTIAWGVAVLVVTAS
jgi:hypothetical protein